MAYLVKCIYPGNGYDCPTKKFAYGNKTDALRAVERLKRRTGADMEAYPCSCGSWHTTTKRKNRKYRT